MRSFIFSFLLAISFSPFFSFFALASSPLEVEQCPQSPLKCNGTKARAVCEAARSRYQYTSENNARCEHKLNTNPSGYSNYIGYYECVFDPFKGTTRSCLNTINIRAFYGNTPAQDCPAGKPLGYASLDIDSSGTACYRGCNYRASGAGVTVTLLNGSRYRNSASWTSTGQFCSASPSDDSDGGVGQPEICKPVNSAGSQHCMNQNGEQCITFKNGDKHCWTSEFAGLEILKNGEQWVNKKAGDAQIEPPNNAKNPTTDAVIKTEKSDGTISTIGWGSTGGLKDGAGSGNGNTGGGGNSEGGGSGNGNGNGNGDGDGNGDGTSAGGGSNCGDPPTCSGDAATCAVYRQVWLQRCDGHGELDGNAGGDFDLPGDIDAALNDEGDDSWRSGEDDTLEHKEISGDALLSKLDSSGFLGGGTCPPPVNISIGGKASMTFSFTSICEMLASASYLVMMLAYYLAIRIITKTK